MEYIVEYNLPQTIEKIRTLRIELREHIIANGAEMSDELKELLFQVYSTLLEAEQSV